ncbi:MAG: hypothetical protein KJ958_00300 [Gammaproteobacteria bacterium]|nr:hypothetical protein [Gammaproteobacteria bacterium]MBU1977588.1 hypothetical protein [Gammaproteobacteria bacterium]
MGLAANPHPSSAKSELIVDKGRVPVIDNRLIGKCFFAIIKLITIMVDNHGTIV